MQKVSHGSCLDLGMAEGRGMRQNSSPHLVSTSKTWIKSLVHEMVEKKGKIPCLVSSSKAENITSGLVLGLARKLLKSLLLHENLVDSA